MVAPTEVHGRRLAMIAWGTTPEGESLHSFVALGLRWPGHEQS